MRKSTYEKYYNSSLWYLRPFDFFPENLETFGLFKVKRQYVDNECFKNNKGKIYNSLEEAVSDSYKIRKMIGINDPDHVLKLLKK